MELTHKHIKSNVLPHQIQQYIDYATALDNRLKTILFDELEQGNYIFEVSTGWPKENSIFVSLYYPFKKRHSTPDGVKFTELNDPHYWKDEYATNDISHFLVCPFK